MSVVSIIMCVLRALLMGRATVAVENLALRQQLIVLERSVKRPRLQKRDRLFWVWLSRLWKGWRSCLLIVKPGTVIRWHRQGFRLYWRWKSRSETPGRPKIDAEIRKVVLRHDRRRVVHFNVTPHPTARWSAQQIVEAFPCEEAPRFLIRDRDGIYGKYFRQRIKRMGIEEVIIAYRSPWQDPFVERLIGTIRRECLDDVIVFNEAHLIRILTAYFEYYHESRTHLSLTRNAPEQRQVEPPELGKVVAIPQVGGLHHRYTRAA